MLGQAFHTRSSILSLGVKAGVQSFHIQAFHARLSFRRSVRRVEVATAHMEQLLILRKRATSLVEKNMLM